MIVACLPGILSSYIPTVIPLPPYPPKITRIGTRLLHGFVDCWISSWVVGIWRGYLFEENFGGGF